MKTIVYSLLLLLILNPNVVHAEIIVEDSISLQGNTIHHISFVINSNISLSISGTSSAEVNLILLLDENYNHWLNQTEYESKVETKLLSEFNHEVQFSEDFNSTLYILFVNLSDTSVSLSYTIEVVDNDFQAPIQIFPIFFSLFFPSLVLRKKSTR
ncbi:MAG: hypothetical protein OEZ01_01260 [Candidatus Heimdallarchaeota archaeon]|nr:hypothetical protein [Candidatus Heimdallarchaeota archaeon]MDH5644602.1 hypothetical protein [Candidatus Heimdallarchaeota archaeon]